MLTYKCPIHDCDHVIEEGAHIEDVVQQLRVHYRAQHPRKYLRESYACEEVERYNQTLEDFLFSNYGAQWENLPRVDLIRSVQALLRQGHERYYSQELRDEAAAFIADAQNPPAEPVVDAVNGQVEVDEFDDPAPAFPGPQLPQARRWFV